jgi:hypothetical protein
MTTETARLRTLPSPKPGDSFGNVAVRRKTVTNGHAKRETKGLTQFNVKVRSRARERFETFFDSLDDGTTKGELLEKMIDAYLRGTAAPTASAPKADLTAGRTEAVPLYATPELADAIQKRAKRHGWTVSAVIENACAIAADCEN